MRKMKILTMILVLAITVVGCKKEEESVSNKDVGSESAINSEYVNLTMVKPKTLNPITNNDKSVGYIMNLIYDGLFTIDQNYDVVPQLVDEYGISQDGKSIDIKLKDVKWHDGTSVTSQDVKFSIDLIHRNSDSPYNTLAQNISSVSIKNDNEFTIIFKEKYPFSIETLIFPIVSKDNIKSLDTKDVNNAKNNLVGNGPYKIENYEEKQGMVLSINEDYYEKLETNAKGIQVEIVPDEEALVSMVIALRSDIANVSLNDLSKFYQSEFNVTTYEGRDYEGLIFNYNNPFLRDVNFRKAIASAINRDKILEEGYMGDATSVDFPLNTKSKYYNEENKQFAYNKDKAKKYLESVKPITDKQIQDMLKTNEDAEKDAETEALENNSENTNNELKDNATNQTQSNETPEKDAETKEEAKNIKEMISELDLKIIVNKENSERLKSAHLISNDLEAIGIKTTINELSEEDMGKALDSKNYDIALVGWELSSVPDALNIIQSSGYSDEKLTNYTTSLLDATTPSQISDIYNSIQKYVNQNVLFMSLALREDYIVTNRRLQGDISPNDFDVYEGISNLKIEIKK
ncbi:MAG: ABC transporter substrate-binding protein [Peptostreptococcaceae bacterium]